MPEINTGTKCPYLVNLKISCKNLTILERSHLSNIFTPNIRGWVMLWTFQLYIKFSLEKQENFCIAIIDALNALKDCI
jgi:hypothetical protein